MGLLETSQKLLERYHLQGAAALVTLSTDHTVPLRLINPTCKPVTIYKGATLGTPRQTDDDLPVYSLETELAQSKPSTSANEQVPVLGDIIVPIELNGRELVCEFYVMQNLAYDAILDRDFLQQNRALIDLDNKNITFKRPKVTKKARKITSNLPVLGTFCSPTTPVGKQTLHES